MNVILGDLENPTDFYLVNVVELFEPPNNKNQSIIVDNTIKSLNLIRENFILLISDAPSYMLLCAKNLKIFYHNLLHIMCFAHALHNCAFKIKKNYPSVDILISSVKSLVHKNHHRKTLFKHLDSIPEPIITRWGSWISAALYYAENLDEVAKVVESINEDEGIILNNAKNAVNQNDLKQMLGEIDFKYAKIVDLLDVVIAETFTIGDAETLLENFDFKMMN